MNTPLSESQILEICHWLDELSVLDVLDRIAEPPPEGFGLCISRQTLWRLTRKLKYQRLQNQAADSETWGGLSSAPNPEWRLRVGAELLDQRAFFQAIDENESGEALSKTAY